jgi:hypothetical protein
MRQIHFNEFDPPYAKEKSGFALTGRKRIHAITAVERILAMPITPNNVSVFLFWGFHFTSSWIGDG